MNFTDHINIYELTLLDEGNFETEGEEEMIKDLHSMIPNKLNKKWKANTIFEERFSIKNLTVFIRMWETIKYKLEQGEQIYTSDLYMEVNNSNKQLYVINVEYDYYKFRISDKPSKNKNYIPLDKVSVTVDKEYKEF